jgi:hypothetical protein
MSREHFDDRSVEKTTVQMLQERLRSKRRELTAHPYITFNSMEASIMVQAMQAKAGKKASTAPAKPTGKSKAAVKTEKPKRAGAKRTKKAIPGMPSVEERQRMIAEAAYYRAQQRGFNGGDTMGDWLAAEAEINAALGA